MSSGDGAPGDGKDGANPSTHFKLLPEENRSVTVVTPFPSLGSSPVTRDSAGPLLVPVGRWVGSPVSSSFSRPYARNAVWKPGPKLSTGENVINYQCDLLAHAPSTAYAPSSTTAVSRVCLPLPPLSPTCEAVSGTLPAQDNPTESSNSSTSPRI